MASLSPESFSKRSKVDVQAVKRRRIDGQSSESESEKEDDVDDVQEAELAAAIPHSDDIPGISFFLSTGISWSGVEIHLRQIVVNMHLLPMEQRVISTPFDLMHYYIPMLEADPEFGHIFTSNMEFRQEVIFLLGRIHQDYTVWTDPNYSNRPNECEDLPSYHTDYAFFFTRDIICHWRGYEHEHEIPADIQAAEGLQDADDGHEDIASNHQA